MSDETYQTKILNDTIKPIGIYETNGVCIGTVDPKEHIIIEAISPLAVLAKYSDVTFSDRDGVTLHQRAGWVEPERNGLVTEFLNKEGHPLETRHAGGGIITLMKGVPTRVVLVAGEEHYGAARVILKKVAERIPVPDIPGYVTSQYVLRDVEEGKVTDGLSEEEVVHWHKAVEEASARHPQPPVAAAEKGF